MIRRRRPVREIHFSFDSFLDVVANVVGIIIRLILVVWVGARAYTGIQTTPSTPAAEVVTQEVADPLVDELEERRRELALVQGADQVPAQVLQGGAGPQRAAAGQRGVSRVRAEEAGRGRGKRARDDGVVE